MDKSDVRMSELFLDMEKKIVLKKSYGIFIAIDTYIHFSDQSNAVKGKTTVVLKVMVVKE